MNWAAARLGINQMCHKRGFVSEKSLEIWASKRLLLREMRNKMSVDIRYGQSWWVTVQRSSFSQVSAKIWSNVWCVKWPKALFLNKIKLLVVKLKAWTILNYNLENNENLPPLPHFEKKKQLNHQFFIYILKYL